MLSTTIVLALILGLLLVSFLLWAIFLRIGLRWAKVTGVTWRRVIIAELAVVGLQIAVKGIVILIALAIPSQLYQPLLKPYFFVDLAISVLIPCLVIANMFGTSLRQTLQAWLSTLGSTLLALAFLLLIFRPYLVETYKIPTNAMAPTLLGEHWQGTCQECGSPTYCSPIPSGYRSHIPLLMICRDNFHVLEGAGVGDQVISGDRLVAVKFLTPQRWDLVVFQFPEDPSTMYVKRLIGLPGETITIHDGEVWADGKRLTPPDSIRGLRYESELDGVPFHLWGAPDNPAVLTDDEYFMLGDFSVQSKDSRLWEQGAPGHNPYAVPESYLGGVVTHIYWPLSRWRVLR